MKRLIILLFASLMSFGLLVACTQSPTATPTRPPTTMPPTMEPDPMPATDLDLTLLGWTDRGTNATAGTFTWTLEIDGSGVGGADEPLVLTFSDVATDLEVEGANNAGCSGLGDLNVEVSGLTVSFSGTIGSGSCSALFAGYDPDDDDTADGVSEGDKVAFEITLAEAPKTMRVAADDAEDQEIAVTGKVTITSDDTRGAVSDGNGNGNGGPATYKISGEVTYKPPTITTTDANQ